VIRETFKKQVKQEERSLSHVISSILIPCTQKESTLAEIVEETKMKPMAMRGYLAILLHSGLVKHVEAKPTRRYRATGKGEEFLRQNLALFKTQKRLGTENAPIEEKSPEERNNKTTEENFAKNKPEEESLILPSFITEETRNENITDNIEEIFARYELKEEQSPWAEPDAQSEIPPKPIPKVEIAPPTMVKTGIPGLDDALNGGIPDHSLHLILGETTAHNITFVHQILYNHVREKGQVAYYSVEFPSWDTRQEMATFGWNLEDFISNGAWLFIDVKTPDLQRLAELSPKIFSNPHNIALSHSLDPLKNDLLNKIQEGRWTALHLSHILFRFNLQEVLDFINYWKTAIRAYGGVHFAILPEGIHPQASVKALEHLADGILDFQLREISGEYWDVMVIKKLRNLRQVKTLPFSEVENGIVVETAAKIGE
jgi:KaiC/GvpD/RAD55 family RecA-like ATPase/predicted transcriptional regulator